MGGETANYYEIGQRACRVRKAKAIFQKLFAEKAGIFKTHMSHIETANTKLSSPAFNGNMKRAG